MAGDKPKLETVFELAVAGEAHAWYPSIVWNITIQHSDGNWAGSANNCLYLFRPERIVEP